MTGLELSLLDVGYNVLRRVPSAALSRTRSIDTLVMDGNLLLSLEKASIANINVINISVSWQWKYIGTGSLLLDISCTLGQCHQYHRDNATSNGI